MNRLESLGFNFGGSLGAALIALCPLPGWAQAPATSAEIPSGPGSLQGTWSNAEFNTEGQIDPRVALAKTADGKPPPLQAWAAKLLAERLKDAIAGHPFSNTVAQCLPAGVPTMMFGPRGLLIQILESPGQITMLDENLTNFRIIRMDVGHKKDPDPTFYGDSVGHWENGDLVVDTIGVTDRTTLDQTGTPHSEDMHVIERYRRTGKDRFELAVTIDDPKTFTAPWTERTHYEAMNRPLEEYLCENQRNRPDASGRTSVQMRSTGQ